MKRQLLGLAATALMATTTLAATDGTLGSTSTGTLNITATVPQPANPTGAKISGLTDISFGMYTGSVLSQSIEFCAYHSSPSASLAISQVGRSTAFALEGPNNQSIPVRLSVLGVVDAGFIPYTAAATHVFTFNRTSQDCSTGGKAAFVAEVVDFSVRVSAAGTYSAQFQLVLATQ